MLNNYDIRISYLKLFNREPSQQELTNASSFSSTLDLETALVNSMEYLSSNNILSYNYSFDNSSNIFSLSNISKNIDSTQGVVLTNGFVGITTSSHHNSCFDSYFKENAQHFSSIDFTNISFSSNNTPLPLSNHTQSLDLNNCKFIDSFSLNDYLSVHIEKTPLHNQKHCFLQKCSFINPNPNTTITISHKFSQQSSFNTYILSTDDNVYKHFSSIQNDTVKLTNLYSFSNTNFNCKGYNIVNEIVSLDFDCVLQQNTPLIMYILTCVSPLDYKSIDHNNVLINAQHHSFDNLIQAHTAKWNTRWSTTVEIINKDSIHHNQTKNVEKLSFAIKYALFNIYSDIYSNNYMFHLPIMILLKPTLAKQVLEYVIDNDTITTDFTSGHEIYKIALLSVHIWNIFRVTKDKGWLHTWGFPRMSKNAEILLQYIHHNNIDIENILSLNRFNQKNNALTNYLVSLAFTFTNQAIYELNFIHIDIYKQLSNSISLQFFNETDALPITDSNLYIKLGSNNNLYHFDFFDSQDQYIGYQFGGDSGHKMSLNPSTLYNFHIDDSLQEYNFMITESNTSNITLSNNTTYSNYPTNIHGYSININNDVFSVFKDSFNFSYGSNAFVSHSIHNVIKPFDQYVFQTLHFAEPYLLFNSYYNHNFQNQNSQYSSSRSELTNIIKDNVTYYSNSSSNNSFNTILEAGLNGFVSQYDSKYVDRRTQMNLCYNKLIEAVVTSNNDPWTNKTDALMTLFVIVTCLFELSPQGETNPNRFLVTDYGLQYNIRNVLPDPWKQISLTNMGVTHKTLSINNALYIDTPFTNLIEAVRYYPVLDDLNNTMTVFANLDNVFASGITDTTHYSVLLQNPGDLSTYNMVIVASHPNSIHNSNYVSFNYSNLTTHETAQQHITEFDNRIINLYINNNGVEKVYRTELPLLKDTSSILSNPTIHATISFESSNMMNVDMTFNSFDTSSYALFDQLDVEIFYDTNIVTSNVNFVSTESFTSNNNILQSKYNLSVTTSSPIASGNFDVGRLIFNLDPEKMHNVNLLPIPFYGTVSSFKTKNIIITNPEVYPPTVHNINTPTGIFYDKYLLPDIGNIYNPISTLAYINNSFPLYQAYTSAIGGFDPSQHIYTISDNIDHTFFTTADISINSLNYHASGCNINNVLMMNSADTYLSSISQCDHLHSFVTTNNIDDFKLYTTTQFNLLITNSNDVYGIGYNESYNLGIYPYYPPDTFQALFADLVYDNDNKTSFTRSSRIQDIIHSMSNNNSNLSHVCLNEKATFLCFNSNVIYGLGESEMFRYLSEGYIHPRFSNDASNLLRDPTLLPRINTFFDCNNYLVQNIETGYEHLKFALLNNDTSQTEWWGIGNNTLSSLGVNPHIDPEFTIQYMKRLHLIETCIHGVSYDPQYDGESVVNYQKYHMIPANGSPNKFTAIMDIITKDVYMIGSMDNGTTIHKTWTKLSDYNDLTTIYIDNPKFAITYNNGIMVGNISDNFVPIVINNAYIESITFDPITNNILVGGLYDKAVNKMLYSFYITGDVQTTLNYTYIQFNTLEDDTTSTNKFTNYSHLMVALVHEYYTEIGNPFYLNIRTQCETPARLLNWYDPILNWEFNNNLSDSTNNMKNNDNYHTDLTIHTGSVSFETSNVVMTSNTVLRFTLHEYLPKRNFAVLIKYTHPIITTGFVTIDCGGGWGISFGYDNTHNTTTISYFLKYSVDQTVNTFSLIKDFHIHHAYITNNENELCLVIDNDIHQEVSMFLNGEKIQYAEFNHSSDVMVERDTLMQITCVQSGLKINDIQIHDIIPSTFLVDISRGSVQSSIYHASFLTTGPTWNNSTGMNKAFDLEYYLSTNEGWIASNGNTLWGWIDMGRQITISRFWVWLHNDVQRSADNFRIYSTNDVSKTTGYLPSNEHFFKFNDNISAIISHNEWNYRDSSTTEQQITNTNAFGTGSDPTIGISPKTLVRGGHDFGLYCASDFYQRTGRYIFLEFFSSNSAPRVVELRIKGYE